MDGGERPGFPGLPGRPGIPDRPGLPFKPLFLINYGGFRYKNNLRQYHQRQVSQWNQIFLVVRARPFVQGFLDYPFDHLCHLVLVVPLVLVALVVHEHIRQVFFPKLILLKCSCSGSFRTVSSESGPIWIIGINLKLIGLKRS